MTCALHIRCGDCGARWMAPTEAEAFAPCARCAAAAAAGRPFYPGSAMPRAERAALKELQAALASGDVLPLGDGNDPAGAL